MKSTTASVAPDFNIKRLKTAFMLYIRAETPQTLPRGWGGWGVGGNLQGWSGKTRSRFEARHLFYPRYQGRNGRRARCSFVCVSAVIAVCVICSGFRRAAAPRLSHFAGLTREIGVLQPPEAPLGACLASSVLQQQQFFGFAFVKRRLWFRGCELKAGPPVCLPGEGSHLRCSRDDARLQMTHVDARTVEGFPAAAAAVATTRTD